MDEKSEDYAVSAARAWFNETGAIPQGYKGCDCPTCTSNCKYYNEQVEQLAAIIRKHVDVELEDLKLQHKADLEFG
jgi:hypothetical protein